MRPLHDKTGERYGRITVLRLLPGLDKNNHRVYECRCDCGTEFLVTSNNLRIGGTKSCGCVQVERHEHRKNKT